jgi:hypothetical protein
LTTLSNQLGQGVIVIAIDRAGQEQGNQMHLLLGLKYIRLIYRVRNISRYTAYMNGCRY